MRLTTRYAIVLGLGLGLTSTGAGAADLPLKRVMLSTGGVAYYEHEAVVEGNSVLTLDVRLDQVDDVLKSIVVYDASGQVGSIQLPGRQPLAAIFRDLPFGETDLSSLAQMLGSLQGAEIEVAGGRAVRGQILSVVEETARDENGKEIVRHRVAVVAADGVQQFILEEAGAIRFLDDKLARDVGDALKATARHRVMDRRTFEIDVRGTAKRAVRVGYVVAAPLWKTAYRLTVTEGAGKGFLQGWAVLENQSGHDWKDVELTLVSGSPVTFRQALYESYYVSRPELPLDGINRIIPQVDTGTVDKGEMMRERATKSSRSMTADLEPRMAVPAPMLSAAPPAARAAEKTETTEAATQLLFRMPRPVSVKDGNSLVVPIIDRDVPAARLGLFDRRTNPANPLIAIRLTNDGETSLPSGIFTVYERSSAEAPVAFVGDARIGVLPKGEERFASFALDPKIRVDEERTTSKEFRQANVSKGVITLSSVSRETSLYRVGGPAGTTPAMIIQHPRKDGWNLVEPDPKAVPLAQSFYRIPVTPGADGKAQVAVVLERLDKEAFGILDLDGDRLVALSQGAALSQPLKTALKEAARLKMALEALQRSAEGLGNEREAVVTDQERIRENLGSAAPGSDLQRRFQKKLGEQETRIEQIDAKLAELAGKITKAREELSAFIAGMNF